MVSLQRNIGSADAGILADLLIVHLDEGVPREEGVCTEESSAKVVQAAWGIVNADDAGIVRGRPRG